MYRSRPEIRVAVGLEELKTQDRFKSHSNRFDLRLTTLSSHTIHEMTKALQIASEANNLGVSLMKGRHFRDALEIFRHAADLMYALTQDLKQQLMNQPNTSSSSSSSSSCASQKMPPMEAKMEELLDKHGFNSQPRKHKRQRTALDEEKDEFIYNEGLLLPLPAKVSKTCALESATILYNMALAYHLSSNAKDYYASDSHALHNAVTLYEMACCVAYRVERQQDGPKTKCSSRVVMASLNNMGQIYHRLGKYTKSRFYLDDLSNYILTSTAQEEQQEDKAEDDPERRRFLLNAMFLQKPRGAAAA